MNTGLVRITGPMTKEEKAKLDAYEEHKAEALWEVGELKKLLESEPNAPGNVELRRTIAYVEGKFQEVDLLLSKKFGSAKKNRRAP
jgi:hypothetical protein